MSDTAIGKVTIRPVHPNELGLLKWSVHYRSDTLSYDFGEKGGEEGLWLRVVQGGPGENDLGAVICSCMRVFDSCRFSKLELFLSLNRTQVYSISHMLSFFSPSHPHPSISLLLYFVLQMVSSKVKGQPRVRCLCFKVL